MALLQEAVVRSQVMSLHTDREEVIIQAMSYFRGGDEAGTDWAKCRTYTMNSAGIPENEDLYWVIEKWYDPLPHVRPQDEPEANENIEFGTIIQHCRELFQHELTHDDVEFMMDVGYTLEEYIEYIGSIGGFDTKVTVYTDADLASLEAEDPVGESEYEEELSTTSGVTEAGEESCRFVSQDYEHRVAECPGSRDIDAVSAISFAYGEVKELPMPPRSAAYWQKEAAFVCRALVKTIDRKIEFLVEKFMHSVARAEWSRRSRSRSTVDKHGGRL
jgi:hypothetical protein